ncbi:MAG: 50S ribosomal protein L10 [Ignavibacteriae bacterium]|jgi:large subunit ribosomal protein L10|nr:50S ribosomal protein L10 [Ignavibacteriota bacterium]NOG97564.1 50S ribosomal protein L10 [Ignavibacteriota bacterium]
MNKTEKEEIVAEISEHLNQSTAVFLVDYNGINVSDISQLRREFLKEGLTYKVYKNTLFKKSITDLGKFEKFEDILQGMNGFIFTGENYVAPAKIIKKYFDKEKKFILKGCYIDDQYFGGDKLDVLASMPTKEEVMSSIVGSIAAPASGIVGAINAVMRDVVGVVDAISKKEAA